MSIEADIYSSLTAHAGLSALIGTRLYPVLLPQNPTYPAVTYQRVSTPRAQAINGTVASAGPRFQFAAWASTYSSAVSVAAQVRAALIAMSGNIVTVYEVLLDGEREVWEDDPGVFRRDVDALILHSE